MIWNLNMHIHEATPRYAVQGMKPWSYAIIFSDWQGMIWWSDGSIQNVQHPMVSKPEAISDGK